MKTFALGLILVVVFTSHHLSQATSTEEAEVQKTMEQCIKEANVSAGEAKVIMADNMSNIDPKDFSANLKCFLLCFYKKLGLVDANLTLNNEKLLEFMNARFENKKDNVKTSMAKCANIKDANPCEMIYKYEVCMTESIG